MKLDKQTVGNVGLHYVCYQLARRGWNVIPTARNARGVDILIYSSDAKRKLSVQVKALSRRSAVPLGGRLESFFADWFIICRNVATESPECFVLTPKETRTLALSRAKQGMMSHWLQRRAYDNKKYREAWNRIGSGAE